MSRIILKISGEALKSASDQVSKEKLQIILEIINTLQTAHHQISIVVGGGNFFRGREHMDMNNVTKDTIGMLGTVMNALYIKDYFDKHNVLNTIKTPFTFPNLIQDYSNDEIKEKYDNNEVIIFGGGVGKSGYSTDSGTILAAEMVDADLIIKLTNVDGVYDADPKKNPKAVKFDYLTYDTVIENEYNVMDLFAIEECKERKIKILVMNFEKYKNIPDYFAGKNVGTVIGG